MTAYYQGLGRMAGNRAWWCLLASLHLQLLNDSLPAISADLILAAILQDLSAYFVHGATLPQAFEAMLRYNPDIEL